MTPTQARSFKKWQLRQSSPTSHQPSSSDPNHNPHRYEILIDEDSRDLYDRYGVDGISNKRGGAGGPGPGGMDPADIFAELFGGGPGMRSGFDFGGGPGSRPRRTKGEDSVIPYNVTLEDLYNGKSVKMNMEKEVVCSSCKG